jgi:hypothetical protein
VVRKQQVQKLPLRRWMKTEVEHQTTTYPNETS